MPRGFPPNDVLARIHLASPLSCVYGNFPCNILCRDLSRNSRVADSSNIIESKPQSVNLVSTR